MQAAKRLGVRFAGWWCVPAHLLLWSNLSEIRMAEIHVEPRRRSLAWLWVLLGLVVIGALTYYFMYS